MQLLAQMCCASVYNPLPKILGSGYHVTGISVKVIAATACVEFIVTLCPPWSLSLSRSRAQCCSMTDRWRTERRVGHAVNVLTVTSQMKVQQARDVTSVQKDDTDALALKHAQLDDWVERGDDIILRHQPARTPLPQKWVTVLPEKTLTQSAKRWQPEKWRGRGEKKSFGPPNCRMQGILQNLSAKANRAWHPQMQFWKWGKILFFFLRCWRIYTRCTSLKMIILIKAYFWDLLSNFILPFWKTMLECELLYMDYSDKLTTMM